MSKLKAAEAAAGVYDFEQGDMVKHPVFGVGVFKGYDSYQVGKAWVHFYKNFPDEGLMGVSLYKLDELEEEEPNEGVFEDDGRCVFVKYLGGWFTPGNENRLSWEYVRKNRVGVLHRLTRVAP